MTGRDRILAALDGRTPDRIPLALSFFDVNGTMLAPPGTWREDLVDVAFVKFPISPEEAVLRRWAMPFEGNTRIGNVAQAARYAHWHYRPQSGDHDNPLEAAETVEDLERSPFPDVTGSYVAEGLAHQIDVIHALGLAAAGNLPHLGGEMFEAAWRLRGFENFMFDLLERKEMAHFLLDRLADLASRNAASLARAGVDVLALDDDVGMPGTMMISPAIWREFLGPRLARIIETARAHQPGLRVAYHSDGHIEPILDDLVDLGVNAINPVQPDHMDALRIRRRYGPRLALWGTVGRQTTFAFATPDEIRREVRERADALGPAGLVLSPAYDIDEPDVPWANVAAFLEAGRQFGAVGVG